MKKALISLLLLLLLMAMLCAQETDYVPDARNLLNRLYAGDLSVADRIDWTAIELFDIDYYEDYAKLTTEQEKQDFRDEFIRQFANRCLGQGLNPEALTGWNMETKAEKYVLVFADWYPDWLNMVFTKDGTKILLKDIYIEYEDDYYDY